MPESYCLNSPEVVSETIDGEAVVVNLAEGIYYSLQDSATDIWELLLSGLALDDVLAHLERRFEAPRATLQSELSRFLGELRQEGLLRERPEPATAQPSELAAPKPFQPPRLERFTDMQELLALDPIHQVDEARGWPQQV